MCRTVPRREMLKTMQVSQAANSPRYDHLVVIEVDGATWHVIDPLIDRGCLPNFARLKQSAAWGILDLAGHPAWSPAVWTTIATGKGIAKHGVDFFSSTARSVRCKRIWDLFQDRGLPIGLCGTLVTWPPEPVQGFVIPSLFALGSETHPPKLRFLQELGLNERSKGGDTSYTLTGRLALLRNLLACGLSTSTFMSIAGYLVKSRMRSDFVDRFWRKAILQPRIYCDVFLSLYRRYDPFFADFHYHVTDNLSHRYWHYWEPESFPDLDPGHRISSLRHAIPAAYITADRVIGRILSAAGPQSLVVTLSDHGFRAVSNAYPKYLARIEQISSWLGVDAITTPAHVGSRWYLYFKSEQEADLGRTSRILSEVRVENTQEPVFEIRQEENYVEFMIAGKSFSGHRFVFPGVGIVSFEQLFTDRGAVQTGDHAPEGVLIIRGPGIRPGEIQEKATVYDITPTLLHLIGWPVAQDMDGRPLVRVEETPREPSWVPTYEDGDAWAQDGRLGVSVDEEEALRERLRALGYL
jgi:predicted AlkP superfamily phosphohydrolase/phosphomutase